jgi:hypothetical protein
MLIRPAVRLPIERYTSERKAEFFLTNAIDEADYMQARKEEGKPGLQPDAIPHWRPKWTDRLFLDANVLL